MLMELETLNLRIIKKQIRKTEIEGSRFFLFITFELF